MKITNQSQITKQLNGGTLGLDLLCYMVDAEKVLILDIALTDGPPGSLLRATDDEVPAFFGMRTSAHKIALADPMAVTKLRGTSGTRGVGHAAANERTWLGSAGTGCSTVGHTCRRRR